MDTGIGIPPEYVDRLFQSFSQIDASTTRKYGGTGLGLAICKKLAELMGGTIGVASVPGQGSTFWFTIQVKEGQTENRKDREIATQSRGDLRNLHVLIVDDNATNRLLLRRQISTWGMYADFAEDGMQALELLKTAFEKGEPYHLALLDLQMPRMDGLELAHAIRTTPAFTSIKLVLLTSVGEREEQERARQAGIDAYLTKPVRQARLLTCLTSLMGQTPVSDTLTASQENFPQLETTDMGGIRPLILVAEDNAVNQKLAIRLLEKLGYRADVVANGLEALEALSRISYQAVLMDCQMPEMDGYEATREIRRREVAASPTSRMPVIAMTANAMQGDREQCLEAGMDDYLTKPIKPEELRAMLKRWIRQQLNAAA